MEQQTSKKQLVLVRMVGILEIGIWWRCPHPREGEGSPKGEPVWLRLAGQGRVSLHSVLWGEWLLSPACLNRLYHWALVLTQLFAPTV